MAECARIADEAPLCLELVSAGVAGLGGDLSSSFHHWLFKCEDPDLLLLLDGDRVVLEAHKGVLKMASSIFKAKLENAGGGGTKMLICSLEDKGEAMVKMLSWIYPHRRWSVNSCTTLADLVDIAAISRKYEVGILVDEVASVLWSRFGQNNQYQLCYWGIAANFGHTAMCNRMYEVLMARGRFAMPPKDDCLGLSWVPVLELLSVTERKRQRDVIIAEKLNPLSPLDVSSYHLPTNPIWWQMLKGFAVKKLESEDAASIFTEEVARRHISEVESTYQYLKSSKYAFQNLITEIDGPPPQ